MARPCCLILLTITLWLSGFPAAEFRAAETGIGQARELIKSGDFASAAELLRRLAAENPQAGEVNFYLGLATLADEKRKRSAVIEEASGHFIRAAKNGYHLPFGEWKDFPIREKRFTDANWAAAQKYLREKDLPNTEITAHLLQNIIAVDPKAHNASRELGELYLRTGWARKAIEHYYEILEANPGNNQEIYSLDLEFLDIYLPEHANRILDCFSGENPENLSPLEKLFVAHSQFVLENDSLACSYYNQCLDSLDEVTAAEIFRDITDIVFEKDREEFDNAGNIKDKQVFFRRFWKSRDPSPATDYNERVVEHYRRLNHARQNFHINMRNGYDDRGRIYIKHGEPDQEATDFTYARENVSWLYRKKPRDFIFHFLRNYTNYEILPNLPPGLYESRGELDPFYSFADMKYKSGDLSDMDRMETLFNENEVLLPAFSLGETTDTYNPYPNIEPFDYYFYTADFMSQNSNSSFYIYYGLPVLYLETRDDSTFSTVNYECSLTLYDREWDVAAEAHDERTYRLRPDPDKVGKGSLVIDRQIASLPPGEYFYTVSVKDRNSGHIGVYRDTIEVTPYEHGRFNMSQAVLATGINKLEDGVKSGKFSRGRLNVMALPSRTFRRDQKVFIYCEIYYLSEDSRGKKRYNIDFSIKADKLDKELVSKIFTPFGKLLGKKEDMSSITMTFDKEQESPARVVQQEYISIDISDSPPGKYEVNITVTDNATGERVTRKASFTIVKAG